LQVFDLKQLKAKSTVVVTLKGSAANVRLLDSSGYSAFKAGRTHNINGGGLVKKSPHRMVVPRSGHWYVTVDLMGMKPNARVSATVTVEQPPLRAARSASLPATQTVSQTPSSLAQVRAERPPQALIDGREAWDVFISHASDDKSAVARPLRNALEELGVMVWFDAFELGIGDSLRRKIDQGLAGSTFGVVILSPAFFAKDWPQYELDGLVTRSVAGQQSILPIWHNITRDEVMAQSPSLADKLARSTDEYAVAAIADEIGRRVRPDLFDEDLDDSH
jgi:hypothetical protein